MIITQIQVRSLGLHTCALTKVFLKRYPNTAVISIKSYCSMHFLTKMNNFTKINTQWKLSIMKVKESFQSGSSDQAALIKWSQNRNLVLQRSSKSSVLIGVNDERIFAKWLKIFISGTIFWLYWTYCWLKILHIMWVTTFFIPIPNVYCFYYKELTELQTNNEQWFITTWKSIRSFCRGVFTGSYAGAVY